MTQLDYSQAEIEAEHSYAEPHIVCGQRLHGGFDESGNYLSPRTRNRWKAVEAWQAQLSSRGVPLVEATTKLLTKPNFPNVEQQLFLLQAGVRQSLWDSLTITGMIEARGRALADIPAPDFSKLIVEDVSATALSHMGKGLLRAHGWDEGGRPDSGEGGHDQMWFAARDLLFDAGAFPLATPPDSIGREKAEREMTMLPAPMEMLMSFMMNLLMIEVRAARAFDFYEQVIRDPGTFTDRPQAAELAAEVVGRVRQDESVHVAWLTTALSEFRSFTIRTVDGGEMNGAEILDPVWERMVHWHSVEMIEMNRENQRRELHWKIEAAGVAPAVIQEFESLAA